MDKQQEASQTADSISTVGVTVKDYPPSEVYSSEPPPAYVRPRANAVQIARIAAVTLVAVSFILGFFMLASAYITASYSCSYGPEYPQQEAEDRPSFQHLVDPLETEESSQQTKRESVQLASQNQLDDQEKPVQIKLPLQLDFDEIAGSMMEKNQRSRMNCVVEKRRAEEVMDHQPKTVRLPFGVNLTTDPRYEHITGERMAIFCESGNDQRHVPMEQQVTPIVVPVPIHHPVPVPVPQMHPPQMHPAHIRPPQMMQQPPQGLHPAQLQHLAQLHQARMIQEQQAQRMMQEQHAQRMMQEQHAQRMMQEQHAQRMIQEQQAQAQQQQHQRTAPQPHMVPPPHMHPLQPQPHHMIHPQQVQVQVQSHLQQMQPPHPQPASSEEQPVHIIREEHIIPIFQVEESEETPVPSDTVRPPPPPQYHRLPIHVREQLRLREQEQPQPIQVEEQRPHYVQPRSVRDVDSVLHRRDKRVRRCACDCSC